MLKKSKISQVKIYSDQWYINRLAKFTSSEIYYLMKPTGFEEGAINYIRRKVGEELTGKPSRGEIDVEATRWGNFFESEALNKFAVQRGIELLVAQQLICEPEDRFGCTPDGLIPLRISPDKTEYEVETIEIKCPPTFDNYIRLFECDTPQDLRNESKQYYWQVLDQLDNCGALVGNFIVYHPDFKAGNMKIIRFDAMQSIDAKAGKTFPIYTDLKLLRERKKMAEQKFDEIRAKLISVPAV
jgi:YqaJ-like recombinase protein